MPRRRGNREERNFLSAIEEESVREIWGKEEDEERERKAQIPLSFSSVAFFFPPPNAAASLLFFVYFTLMPLIKETRDFSGNLDSLSHFLLSFFLPPFSLSLFFQNSIFPVTRV